MSLIPYGRQSISSEDVEEVIRTLRSDWLTQGPAIEKFENEVATYCGATAAVAVSSATAGLHLGCLALGLGKGDLLWTSPNSFVASANCALYCGADVDFVDIDSRTYNLCTDALEKKLEGARRLGKLPKVVVPVHFAGQSCDMMRIAELAKQYGFSVMEDASHAIGGSYQGKPVGSCSYSDLTVFSFHPVKIITSGEGGMVLSRDQKISDKIARLQAHGITREPEHLIRKDQGAWYYEQIELGFNYRMTDIQATLGSSQLRRISAFRARREEIARRYNQELADLPLILPYQAPGRESSWHLYVVQIDSQKVSRSEVFARMREAGIGVNVHYIPIHTHPYYQRLGFKEGAFPQAETYYQSALTLPIYPDLTEEQQWFVIRTLKESLC